jgi:hypothetical protein
MVNVVLCFSLLIFYLADTTLMDHSKCKKIYHSCTCVAKLLCRLAYTSCDQFVEDIFGHFCTLSLSSPPIPPAWILRNQGSDERNDKMNFIGEELVKSSLFAPWGPNTGHFIKLAVKCNHLQYQYNSCQVFYLTYHPRQLCSMLDFGSKMFWTPSIPYLSGDPLRTSLPQFQITVSFDALGIVQLVDRGDMTTWIRVMHNVVVPSSPNFNPTPAPVHASILTLITYSLSYSMFDRPLINHVFSYLAWCSLCHRICEPHLVRSFPSWMFVQFTGQKVICFKAQKVSVTAINDICFPPARQEECGLQYRRTPAHSICVVRKNHMLKQLSQMYHYTTNNPACYYVRNFDGSIDGLNWGTFHISINRTQDDDVNYKSERYTTRHQIW